MDPEALFQEARELEEKCKWIEALHTYYNCIDASGELTHPLSHIQRKSMQATAELSCRMNWFSQSISAYLKLIDRGGTSAAESARTALERIQELRMLPPRPSMRTMKGILVDETNTAGIRAMIDGVDLVYSLKQFPEEFGARLEGCEPNRALPGDFADMDDHLRKFKILLHDYRVYLAGNSIHKRTSLWHLVAERIVSPDEDNYDLDSSIRICDEIYDGGTIPVDKCSILSVIDGLCTLKRRYDVSRILSPQLKKALSVRLKQLGELCKMLQADFAQKTIWDSAREEWDENFAHPNVEFRLDFPVNEDFFIPRARALFNVLFDNSVKAEARKVSLSFIEKGEGGDHWLFIKILDDGNGFEFSKWQSLNLDEVVPNRHNVIQGSGLAWIVILVKELGGEVIVRSGLGPWIGHCLGPGAKVSKYLIERMDMDGHITEGTEITLVLPIFLN